MWKYHIVLEPMIHHREPWFLIYLYYLGINCLFVAFAATVCLWFEPIAAGGGLSEVKLTLNGVTLPRLVRFKTLLVKLLGLIPVCACSLPAGKEGPFIHIGAIVAAGLSQGKSTTMSCDTSFTRFSAFRNDHEKGEFIVCGAAMGVAVAFGAPVGGLIFAFEEASSFWNPYLTWRACFGECDILRD